MPGPSSSRGAEWPAANDGDSRWGPSTAVRGGTARGTAPRKVGRAFTESSTHDRAPRAAGRPGEDGWSPAGPAPREQQRANRVIERRTERSIRDLDDDRLALQRAPERGLPWWAALGILIAIAIAGGIIDTVGSISVKGGFNIGIVVASIVAILIVKRSHMFPVVIAPPIVYSLASVFQLYLRSDGLSDKKVVFDAAANYLVYGFPAIAAASAAVLIIAGVRMIAHR